MEPRTPSVSSCPVSCVELCKDRACASSPVIAGPQSPDAQTSTEGRNDVRVEAPGFPLADKTPLSTSLSTRPALSWGVMVKDHQVTHRPATCSLPGALPSSPSSSHVRVRGRGCPGVAHQGGLVWTGLTEVALCFSRGPPCKWPKALQVSVEQTSGKTLAVGFPEVRAPGSWNTTRKHLARSTVSCHVSYLWGCH